MDGPSKTNRLTVVDKITGTTFLTDSGAEISVIPRNPSDRTKPSPTLTLYAANKTPIHTYGQKTMTIDLGLPRLLKWNFVIADVPHAIMGADLLVRHRLVIDLDAHCLIDKITSQIVKGAIVLTRPVIFSLNSPNERQVNNHFNAILNGYPEVIGLVKPKVNMTTQVRHYIPTKGPPVSARSRRLPADKYTATKIELDFLLGQGIIQRSSGPWASPIHHVKKKNGQWRMVGDYVKLNAITKVDKYALPHCHDFHNMLFGKTIFSTLDLERAYQQIPMAPEDVSKTAIITPFGTFEYLYMPYGLKGAAQTFQRYIDEALKELPFASAYIDDIIIASNSPEEHSQHLKMVLERLKRFGLVVNPNKCIIAQPEVEYLGFLVTKDGVKPLKRKVHEIMEFSKPKTVCQLQKFLGMINFYRRSIPHAAELQLPLNKYIGKSKKKDQTPIKWSQETTQAFYNCKKSVADAILLAYPARNAKLRLVTDASMKAVGAAFEQLNNEGFWQPLGMFSQKLTPAQTKYSTYDRELLAIYKAVKYFRQLLEGCEFEILTDHKPLVYAFHKKSDTASPRQTRYLDFVSQFSTNIVHVAGKENPVADYLSRVETLEIPSEINYVELSKLQQADRELKQLQTSTTTSCTFQTVNFGEGQVPIVCETSTGRLRPYIPEALRKVIFDQIHRLSHPSGKATLATIKQRYIWPNMRRHVIMWARSCADCQTAKIHRYVKSTPDHFQTPEARFDHVHMDIVGPFPPCREFKYILTVIDRFSRWPEAFPIKDITADVIAETFYSNWICRFGAPKIVTTDQGSQFESAVFRALCKLLGIQKNRTTSYHPASNGLIERWHRSLKASLMCIGNRNDWADLLPTALLGLRTCVKEKLNASPAEFLYGKTLRIPNEFLSFGVFKPNRQVFMEKFREHMKELQPIPVAHHNKAKPFCFKALHDCTHVFLRCGNNKTLEKPYLGPFKIIERINHKVFCIDYYGKNYRVNVERLKPAYFEGNSVELDTTQSIEHPTSTSPVTPCQSNSTVETPSVIQTQQYQPGRHVTTRPGPSQIAAEHNYTSIEKPMTTTGILKTPTSSNVPVLRTYPPAKKKVQISDKIQTKVFFMSTKLYDEIN